MNQQRRTRHSKDVSLKSTEMEVEVVEQELEEVEPRKRPRTSSAEEDDNESDKPYVRSRTGAWSPGTIMDVQVSGRHFTPPSEYSQDRWLWNLTLLKAYAWRRGSKIFQPLPVEPFRRSTSVTLGPKVQIKV